MLDPTRPRARSAAERRLAEGPCPDDPGCACETVEESDGPASWRVLHRTSGGREACLPPRTEDGAKGGTEDGAKGGTEDAVVIVPPGHVFVLGDNRDASVDSRRFGTVPLARGAGRIGGGVAGR